MATRPPSEPPRTSSKLNLEDVLLDNVEITREPPGSLGTYGKVSKAYYYGSPCAGKEFNYSWTSSIFDHNAFDLKGIPKSPAAREFMKECLRCTKLRHPNVVQFYGVYYKESSGTGTIPGPVLIVEKMGDTLKKFLTENTAIEMSCKLSILLDVARGLMYLHSRNPKIVHGGLTSEDVLLTDSIATTPQVKIYGDPKVFYSLKQALPSGFKPHNKDLTEFLPYETRGDCLDPDPSVDIFCYGGIMLHTLTQEWPKPLSVHSHLGLKSGGGSKSTIEIERRSKYIKKVNDHMLEQLIKSCLDDNAKTRPTFTKVHESILNAISHQEPKAAAAKSSTTAKITQKDKAKSKSKTKETKKKLEHKDQENQQEDIMIHQKDEIELKNKEIQEKSEVIEQKNDEIERMRNKLNETENQLKELKLQQENVKSINESHHVNSEGEGKLHHTGGVQTEDKKLQHTGTQTENKEVDEEVKPMLQQEERKEIIKSQHMGSKNEQTNNSVGKVSRNDIDENDQNEQYKGKKAKMPSNRQTEQKEKQVDLLPAIDMCKVNIQPSHVIANEIILAIVTLKNAQGKPIINCGSSIKVFIQQNEHQSVASLPINFTELGNGHYSVSFAIEEAGDYKLHMCVDNHKIIGSPLRIRCVRYHYPQQAKQASELGSHMRVIKPLQNATATSCYFNSVLQVLNQTTGFVKMMLKYDEKEKRFYAVSYKNDTRNVETKLPVELSGEDIHTVLHTLKFFLQEVESDLNVVIKPDYVLFRLTENSSFKHQRQVQHTQEDSHELLRYLLYELKKEEIDLIKKEAQSILKNNFGSGFSSNPQLDESDKKALKNLSRDASKKITPIEEVFGGIKLNTVICRECQTPLQTFEPFFDISLGLPDFKQERCFNSGYSYRQNNQSSVPPLWQPQQTRANYMLQHSHSGHAAHTTRSHTSMYATNKAQYGEYDKESVQALLKSKKNLFYQPVPDRPVVDPSDVEVALADHTDVDNMDENNKFICKACTEKKGTTADGEVQLCLVTKQILIHQIPQTLILHFKRFNIDTYMVTKETKHVSFSPILNMAPYCSNKCLEDFGDKSDSILYGLYGVVEHMGQTLQSGHYIAYVRKRPERQQESKPANKDWEYDRKAAHDGKWFRTSDLTVRECMWGFEEVKDCNAYMLFYELLPRKGPGSLV